MVAEQRRSSKPRRRKGSIRDVHVEMDQYRECDMCGESLQIESVCSIDGEICLCPDCFCNVEDLPEGPVKENIKRQLAGNII